MHRLFVGYKEIDARISTPARRVAERIHVQPFNGKEQYIEGKALVAALKAPTSHPPSAQRNASRARSSFHFLPSAAAVNTLFSRQPLRQTPNAQRPEIVDNSALDTTQLLQKETQALSSVSAAAKRPKSVCPTITYLFSEKGSRREAPRLLPPLR